MKRKIAFFLALTLVFSAFFALSPISAYAEETEYTDLYDDSSLLGKYSPAEIYEANKDACDFIAAQVRELKEVINLRSYNLDSNHMGEIFYSVICENPDVFYVLSSTISTTSTMDDFVVSIQPEYTFDKAQIPSEIEKFNAASAKFLSGVDSDWSDIVKARYIHDLLAQYTEYEMDYGSISSADPDFYDKMRIYTSYGPIVNGVAVCEGYTMAYNYLLARVGIRGYSVRSAVARHAWSIVKIGGSYYHVDVTHDDPIYDNLGRSAHNNFLKSDTYFANDGDDNHVRWIFGEKASDTSYDSYWWNDVDTAIYPYSGKEYYIDQNYNNQRIFALVARDSSDKISDVYVNSDRWYVKNTTGAVWSKSFGYLTADNKYFYFNDTSRVYRLEKGKTQPEVIYTKPDAEQRDLFGLAFKGSDLYAALKENPNTADEVTKVYTPEVPTEPTTEAPSTAVPTTAEPTTEAPTTAVPTTAEPTTEAPTTTAPTTAEPTTEAPTTAAPTTAEPTTEAPTTAAPTTAEPTTEAPTTAAPTTAEPTTEAPTTAAPTTAEPTTEAPTTAAPTTAEPTTQAPTTAPIKTTVIKKTISMYIKYKSTVTIEGKSKCTYSTNNKKVAVVSTRGVITAKKAGTAVITIKATGVVVRLTVKVKNPTLNKSKLSLKKGKTFTVKVKGGSGRVTFKSSNKKVVTVSTKGKLKAIKRGTATITVTVCGIKLKCKVTVK